MPVYNRDCENCLSKLKLESLLKESKLELESFIEIFWEYGLTQSPIGGTDTAWYVPFLEDGIVKYVDLEEVINFFKNAKGFTVEEIEELEEFNDDTKLNIEED